MLHRIFALLFLLSNASLGVAAENVEKVSVDSDVTVSAQAISLKDDVQTSPDRVSIAQPRVAPSLSDSVRKLPGALSLENAGPGTQTTAMAPIATGSGGTLISVDGNPVLAPLGRGTDLSFLPSSFFKRLDWFSPFYPWAEGLTAPGGRLDLITRTAEKYEYDGSVSALYGTANTAQISVSGAKRSKNNNWLVGLSGFRSEGTYNYVDPFDLSQKNRTNNDNRFGASILKFDHKSDDGIQTSALLIGNTGHRTDPPSTLSYAPWPPVVQGTDTGVGHDTGFGMLAAQVGLPNSVLADAGQKFTISHSFTRAYYTNIQGAPGQGGENSSGTVFTYQIQGKTKRKSVFLQLDGENEAIEAYYPLDKNRQTAGFTAAYDAIQLGEKHFFIPRARVEQSSTMGGYIDGSISYIHEMQPGHELFASITSEHKVPTMIALYGYTEGGTLIAGLPSLATERAEISSLGYNYVGSTWGLWLSSWFSHHRNMAIRSGPAFVQVADAQTYGLLGSLSCGFWDHWYARLSGTLQNTRINDDGTVAGTKNGHELTFKPTHIASLTITYDLTSKWSMGLEQTSFGQRYGSTSNSAQYTFAQVDWTTLRSDLKIGPGTAYVKLGNIFDRAGYDNYGYPYPGRSYWVGYTIDSAAF